MMTRASHHHELFLRCILYFLIFLSFHSADDAATAIITRAQSTSSSTTFGGELAYFETPQMTQNVSHRQDVCDLYDSIRNGTLELKDALQGRQLNVVMGAYVDSYFRYTPEEGIDPVYPGIAAVLMDELARRAGFTWRNSFGIYVNPKGAAYNESWTDLLIWNIDAYDLCVDWWPRNLERLTRGAAFTQEWYDSSIIMIGKKQQTNKQQSSQRKRTARDYWNFLKPFSWEVWMTTFATVVLSGFAFQILEHLNGNRRDRKWFEWWSENLFMSAINATQAYEYGTPKGLPSKLFCFSMALWSLILTATYTANLASLLVEEQQDGARIIQTIQEAAVFGYPICTWEGTNSDSYIKSAFPDAIRKPKQTLEGMYQGLHTGECAFAIEVIQQWLINEHVEKFNPDCDLEWVGNGKLVSASAAGFAASTDAGFKCTGLIRDVINIHMEEMIRDGFLRDAWDVENSLAKEVDCSTFRPEQFLNSNVGSNTGTDSGRRRRKLEETKRRLQAAKRSNSVKSRLLLDHDGSLHHSHRWLKAGSKAAASSGAMDGEANQMELDAMMGTFLIHWAFTIIAITMGIIKKYYRENHKSPTRNDHIFIEQHPDERNGSNNQTERFEASIRIKDELQWQMEDLLYTFKQSKATLIKEQEELQSKMDLLRGMMEERKHFPRDDDDLSSL